MVAVMGQRNEYNYAKAVRTLFLVSKAPPSGKYCDLSKRNRSRRWLWEHFDKINDTTLQCKLCKLPVKHSTNMLQHIRRKHSDLYKIKVEENVIIEKIKNKPLPRKRGRPHRSWVWAYFVRTSKNRATCKICDKAICSSFSTTGNLIIHLKKVHKKDAGWIWLVFEEEDESDKYSCRICSFKCTKTEDLKNDIQTICDHLKTEHGLESGDQVSTVPDDKNKVVVKHIKDGSDQNNAVQDVISMYFTKESSDQLKCNICSTVLTTDDNDTAPKDHIRDSHRGVYELHKDILECSMGYQIEFLQFSVSDSKTQPVIIEEICETQPEVIQDQLPKGVENRQYIFLSSVKSDDTCRKRSWVWKYFDKLSQTIFRCNLCNVVLSIKGCNSNNMNRHIRSRHPVIYGSELEMKIKSDEKRTGILSKGKPLRSWVWTYFNRDSRTRATCKLCDKTINHGGNATGNLNRHLKIIHEKNDDPHYWIWKVFDNDSEDYYSCKLCTFKLAKTDNFDICVQIILDHLKDQHGLVSAEQIFTVKDYEEDEG